MRVNLILDAERRSASPVPMRFVRRLLGLVLILLCCVGVAAFVSGLRTLQQELRQAEADWRQMEPRHQTVVALRFDNAYQRSVLSELRSWTNARVGWSRQLEGLRRSVPANVQLTDLRVTAVMLLQSNNLAGRVFELRLAGRTTDPSGSSVSLLQRSLNHQAPFAGLVQEATVPPGAFRQDPAPQASRTDRLFEIVAQYKPRIFE